MCIVNGSSVHWHTTEVIRGGLEYDVERSQRKESSEKEFAWTRERERESYPFTVGPSLESKIIKYDQNSKRNIICL